MDKHPIKPVPFYQCDVTVDEATLPLLQIMNAKECFSVDGFKVQDDQAIMVLNPREINRLRKIGVKVKVKQVLFL
jgi:hypothetical protein